jgi:hypothetical protein
MRNPLRLALIGIVCLAAPTAAWAASKPPAKPVKGANYEGATISRKSTIKLKVARSGKSVTVWLGTLPSACAETGQGPIQKTAPARISSKGAFKGTISYEGLFTAGVDAKATFSGHFNGRKATGTVRAEFLKVSGCNSTSAFTASLPTPAKHS